MLKKNWKPEKPPMNSVAESLTVSARSFEVFCHRLELDVEDLVNKTIVVIGNGLSNSVIRIRELGGNTRAYGIDPIYAYLGKSYDEFLKNLEKLNLSKHQNLKEEDWKKIMEHRRYHIAGLGESMRINDKKVDMVLMSDILGNFGRKEVVERILSESLRVLKDDGEVRVSDSAFQLLEPGRNSLSLILHDPENIHGKGVSINEMSAGDWLRVLKSVAKSGGRMYTTRNTSRNLSFYPPAVYFFKMLNNEGDLPVTYQGVWIRKDEKIPHLTLYTRPKDIKIDSINHPVVRIDAERSRNPEFVYVEPVQAEIKTKPF